MRSDATVAISVLLLTVKVVVAEKVPATTSVPLRIRTPDVLARLSRLTLLNAKLP